MCSVASGDLKSSDIWDNSWVSDKNIIQTLNAYSFIDSEEIDKINIIINNSEVELFKDNY